MAAPQTLKIAAAQYPIGQPGSLGEWEDKIATWVHAGAATGAELLVFPEYAAIEQAACFGPEVYNDLTTTLERVAELAPARVALHAALAKKHNVHILVGSGPAKDGHRFVNAAQLVTPAGSVGVQEKLIMTPFEHDWGVTAGGPLRVFETRLGKIAVLICYDSEFPLLARAAVEAGTDAILVPSCTERISGYHRVRTGSKARALENTIVTVQSPTVGDAVWSPAVDHNVGAAGIYVPPENGVSDDGILAQGTLNESMWVSAAVDLAALRRLRTSGEMRNFGDWPSQPGAEPLKHTVETVTLA
ncbi:MULTISPECIES: carbon-nitrogen hydrolase family protein [Hyphomicrobium]|jgi:predicted amidohydrolase|uniref:carbon-nitrogen hydrolase family protein n=1 Tax=Hyphomicrobium TaxID=81 RepID=UPI0003707F98|nr:MULTISPECIES: carbon-nitrogen hydrolase family protein [Hyphomicrobium]WBT36522.1 carbon-nitrogen hydrolase family protein [Hyphomicrobium sp. DMF-1]HML43826.1 carbon-nitrogen hydrolase family protein [Hyphomicrobium zavarzinii]